VQEEMEKKKKESNDWLRIRTFDSTPLPGDLQRIP
jgi:hypothetical protein